MLSLNAPETASTSITNELSEYLGELAALNIIQNMKQMEFDELVEFKRSIELISRMIQMDAIY